MEKTTILPYQPLKNNIVVEGIKEVKTIITLDDKPREDHKLFVVAISPRVRDIEKSLELGMRVVLDPHLVEHATWELKFEKGKDSEGKDLKDRIFFEVEYQALRGIWLEEE